MNCMRYDYITYMLMNKPSIEYIALPYGAKINKYEFLYKASQIMPFFNEENNNLIYSDTISLGLNMFNSLDNDVYQLYSSIKNIIDNQHKKYDSLTDALIKFAILCENAYLCQHDNVITCKATTFNIDHVLYFLENQISFKGLINYEINKHNFNYVMNGIIYSFLLQNRSVFTIDTRTATPDTVMHGYNNLPIKYPPTEQFSMVYLELLLLVANTYNNHIKELYCNEW